MQRRGTLKHVLDELVVLAVGRVWCNEEGSGSQRIQEGV